MADVLLDALNKRDYDKAKELIRQGRRLHEIEGDIFETALYFYLTDYKMMEFLTENGYNIFFFHHSGCRDDRGRMWGILARAYVLGEYRVMELLFSAGFSVHGSNERYWVEGHEAPYPLWKGLFLNKFDKKLIDMMLSYGCPANKFDNPDYDKRVRDYIHGKPQIELKSFSLGPWNEEIPVPEAPRFSFFTLRSSRDYLNKKYEQEMQEYQEKTRVQKEYVDKITVEEWKALKEHRKISLMADRALANMVKRR